MLMLRSSEFRDAIQELVSLVQVLADVGPQAIREASGLKGEVKEEKMTINTTVQVQPAAVFVPYAPACVTVTTAAYPSTTTTVTSGSSGGAKDHLRREARAKLRRVLQLLASNPQYQQAVRSFFRLFKQAKSMYYDVKDAAKPAKDAVDNEHLKTVWYETRQLLQEFTGGRSVQPLFDNCYEMVRMIVKDQALRAYFIEIRDYIYEGFDNPMVFDDDARMKNLAKRGRAFFKEIQLHDYTQRTIDELKFLINAIRNDPITTRFSADVQRLMHDIFLDAGGNPTVKTEALGALKDIMIGMFMDELKYFPIPRVAGVNESMEYSIDSMNLTLFDLLPENIEIKQKTMTRVHPVNVGTHASNVSESKGYFVMKIHKNSMKIDNIHYSFRRLKTPRISDQGVCSLEILREGIDIKVYITAHFGAKYNRYLHVTNVVARVGKVKLRINQSNHKMLLRFLAPTIRRQIRKRAVTAIEEGVMNQVNTLEGRMQRLIENLGMRTGRPELFQKLAPIQKLLPSGNAPTVTSTAAPASGPRPAY